jgi:hypothetical protein
MRKLLDTPPNFHFGERNLQRLDGYTVITPLRSLDALITSWARRDMELSDLHEAIGIMLAYGSDYYLPLDSDYREEYLAHLNDGLDTDLQTDWAVLEDPKISAADWSVDPTWSQKIHDDYDSFFEIFY